MCLAEELIHCERATDRQRINHEHGVPPARRRASHRQNIFSPVHHQGGRGSFDIVLVWKTNRLSRRLKDLLVILEVLDDAAWPYLRSASESQNETANH